MEQSLPKILIFNSSKQSPIEQFWKYILCSTVVVVITRQHEYHYWQYESHYHRTPLHLPRKSTLAPFPPNQSQQEKKGASLLDYMKSHSGFNPGGVQGADFRSIVVCFFHCRLHMCIRLLPYIGRQHSVYTVKRPLNLLRVIHYWTQSVPTVRQTMWVICTCESYCMTTGITWKLCNLCISLQSGHQSNQITSQHTRSETYH